MKMIAERYYVTPVLYRYCLAGDQRVKRLILSFRINIFSDREVPHTANLFEGQQENVECWFYEIMKNQYRRGS